MKQTTNLNLVAVVMLLCFAACSTSKDKTAKVWQNYVADKENGKKSLLIDYSHAGYAYGEKEIPAVSSLNYPYFDVTKFGAIANDTIADDEAIQAAINEAAKAKCGIVYFPKGRYIVNKGKNTSGFEINHSNIIIKGEGAGAGGTEIFMQDYMHHDKSLFRWTSPHMFTFRPEGLDYDAFCATNTPARPYKIKTDVVKLAPAGSYEIEVADAHLLKGISYLILVMPYNKASMTDFMGDVEMRPQWERINEKGITANEVVQVKAIDGNKIVLERPLLTDVKPEYGWFVSPHTVITECGFEDIHLIGNFQEKFVHHKNKIHDGGWKGVNMAHVTNGWVRRCVFTDVNSAVRMMGCLSSSVLMNVLDGQQGHGSVEMTFGTRNFTGLWLDRTDVGQWHGIDASHMAAGSVAWRISAPQGRGFDLHSGYTRATLYDCYEAYDMSGNGGSYKVEPHHMKDFTLWNFKQTGPAVQQYDYWSMQPRKDNPKSPYWGMAVARPIVVGFHGASTTFKEESIAYLESVGQKVYPESLYEAQLTHRLGKRPAWLDVAMQEWETWKVSVVKD
ncbi:DUF4955 domain-containing protein [Labilibacter marinus]|uniref:DUF4955 domain-containing protein n=1 Tax=Labilibacter marinus TaxID=1477105 RepID=UPI000834B285|nr:DUF4955 domain-containing protein [Labilibacter marinus]